MVAMGRPVRLDDLFLLLFERLVPGARCSVLELEMQPLGECNADRRSYQTPLAPMKSYG